MRKFIIILALLLVVVGVAFAQYAIREKGGAVVPYIGTRWSAQTIACSADTVFKIIEMPAGVYEVLVCPTAGVAISPDTLYANPNIYQVVLDDTTKYVPLPVHNMKRLCIRRAAAGTAASLRMIFKHW